MGFPESLWRMSLSSLPGLILLLISHHFQTGNAEHFKVLGPDQPVVVILGEDAVLPCHLSPALNAEDMQVRWFRTSFDFLVHQYENGMDQNEQQNSKYRGRTELIRNYISCGSVSLRIQNIGLEDEGRYSCYFEFDTYYDEATVELKVVRLGSALFISVNDHQDRGIKVMCESSGWYPEPEVTWRQEDGQSPIAASETETQEQNGLFKVKTSLLLKTNQQGSISCHIRNVILSQEKTFVISIADIFYQRVSRWMVSLSLILISVLIPCGLLVMLVIYHLRKEREEKGQLSADKKNLSAKVENQSENVDKFSADNAKLSVDKENLSADNAKLSADNESLRAELEWRRCCSYAVNVTLDPNTAHPLLIVSEDKKTVISGNTKQIFFDNTKRFDSEPFVLGSEGFSSGKHYWEVQVGDKSDWKVGVCKNSVRRKGQITPSPGEGYWAVELRIKDKSVYLALTVPEKELLLRERPQAVGIFLDYEAGKVSFYNADTKSHIYTFSDIYSFTETLQPFLFTCTSLRIRPVAAWE
uniref:Butyrophilin subfamily 3 member A1-like isoform X2 n=1 Tax=Geotrypetes seraphini TaxID=260995 RepID=A0A6P8PZI2_GEOSA|nr:butyrophilin subfamily 3 member A1-like isoform X2 [Geotrypetes seraphini]